MAGPRASMTPPKGVLLDKIASPGAFILLSNG